MPDFLKLFGKRLTNPAIVEEAYSIIESRIGRVKTDTQDTCVYNYCFEIYMFPYIKTKECKYKDCPRTYSFFHSEFSEQAEKIFDRIIKEISKERRYKY